MLLYTLVSYTIIEKMNMLQNSGFNRSGFDTPESMTHFLGSYESIDLKIKVNLEPRARLTKLRQFVPLIFPSVCF